MKQMKFFLVALMAVVMGMSVTSCMNGDNNTQVNDYPIIGKVKDSMLGSFTFTGLDGYTYKTKNVVSDAVSFYSGDYIIAACSYDTEVDIDHSTKTVNVTVGAVEKISGNEVSPTTKEEDTGENAMYKSNRGVYSASDYVPAMMDNYNLLMTIRYRAHEKRDKHSFRLVYYTDESEMKDKTELKLYLRHNSEEELEKEKGYDIVYRSFNIYGAIQTYYQLNGKYPTRIVIETEANTSDATVPEKTTPVSMDYTFKE